MVVIMVMVMMRRFDDNNKPNTRVAVCACAAKKMLLMFGARAPRMALGCTHKVFIDDIRRCYWVLLLLFFAAAAHVVFFFASILAVGAVADDGPPPRTALCRSTQCFPPPPCARQRARAQIQVASFSPPFFVSPIASVLVFCSFANSFGAQVARVQEHSCCPLLRPCAPPALSQLHPPIYSTPSSLSQAREARRTFVLEAALLKPIDPPLARQTLLRVNRFTSAPRAPIGAGLERPGV